MILDKIQRNKAVILDKIQRNRFFSVKKKYVDAVGVTWGFRPLPELKAESPEFIISEPDELISIAMK